MENVKHHGWCLELRQRKEKKEKDSHCNKDILTKNHSVSPFPPLADSCQCCLDSIKASFTSTCPDWPAGV